MAERAYECDTHDFDPSDSSRTAGLFLFAYKRNSMLLHWRLRSRKRGMDIYLPHDIYTGRDAKYGETHGGEEAAFPVAVAAALSYKIVQGCIK